MERIKLFTYKGRKILRGDYTELTPEEIIGIFRQVNRIAIKSDEKFYALVDFTGVPMDVKIIEFLQNDESRSAARHFIKTAAVGITGITRLGLNVYNRATRSDARAFRTEEEALSWFAEN